MDLNLLCLWRSEHDKGSWVQRFEILGGFFFLIATKTCIGITASDIHSLCPQQHPAVILVCLKE